MQLQFPHLLTALEDDRLLVEREEEVWGVVRAWMEADREQRDQFLAQLLGTIRFTNLDYSFFQANVLPLEGRNQDVVQAARSFLASIHSPTTHTHTQLRAKFPLLPYFGRPRLPTDFLIIIGGYFGHWDD